MCCAAVLRQVTGLDVLAACRAEFDSNVASGLVQGEDALSGLDVATDRRASYSASVTECNREAM
jgi:hypothetical protein